MNEQERIRREAEHQIAVEREKRRILQDTAPPPPTNSGETR